METTEMPALDATKVHPRVMAWYDPLSKEWKWRARTEGRKIEGSSPWLRTALDDLLLVAVAHGLEDVE